MAELWEIIKYIFLGLLQGFTEPIPVSSSGHLVIAQELLALDLPGLTFEAFVNFGSLIAVLMVYRKDIYRLLVNASSFVFQKNKELKNDFTYLLLLALATIPAGLLGVFFSDFFGESSGNVKVIGIALLLTAAAIWIIRNLKGYKNDYEITVKDALIIGLAQAVALLPGISRSGATVVAAMLVGLNRSSALRFSFLMYIPVSIGTSIFAIDDILGNPNLSGMFILYLVAFIASVIASYFALLLFINIMKSGNLRYFAYYCVVVGFLVILFL